jgi:hypothetical protein
MFLITKRCAFEASNVFWKPIQDLLEAESWKKQEMKIEQTFKLDSSNLFYLCVYFFHNIEKKVEKEILFKVFTRKTYFLQLKFYKLCNDSFKQLSFTYPCISNQQVDLLFVKTEKKIEISCWNRYLKCLKQMILCTLIKSYQAKTQKNRSWRVKK